MSPSRPGAADSAGECGVCAAGTGAAAAALRAETRQVLERRIEPAALRPCGCETLGPASPPEPGPTDPTPQERRISRCFAAILDKFPSKGSAAVRKMNSAARRWRQLPRAGDTTVARPLRAPDRLPLSSLALNFSEAQQVMFNNQKLTLQSVNAVAHKVPLYKHNTQPFLKKPV